MTLIPGASRCAFVMDASMRLRSVINTDGSDVLAQAFSRKVCYHLCFALALAHRRRSSNLCSSTGLAAEPFAPLILGRHPTELHLSLRG